MLYTASTSQRGPMALIAILVALLIVSLRDFLSCPKRRSGGQDRKAALDECAACNLL